VRVSTAWLNEWVRTGWDTETLAQRLTMAGFEVESIEQAAGQFTGVVVARVLERKPHPDADKLSICIVDDGGAEPVEVVCGAANARTGMTAALARVGAGLPGDLKISRAKLRGVESVGMLCSARELGMGDSHDGILDLPGHLETGLDLREALGLDDAVLELSLTPNRGDALSMAGVAREVAALSGLPFALPEVEPVTASTRERLEVRLAAPEACPKFVGRIIRGVEPGAATPLWMAERLRRAGLRPVSAVVDVTNYVMLELGQPMHAYDLRRLKGFIEVRHARAGERLELLDGQQVELQADVLVIADEEAAVGIAGVMGGLKSGIADDTTDVFLEVAYFAPDAVAGRARRFGMHTDASQRFERGVDPRLQERAMERATQLMLDIAGGRPGPIVVTEDKAKLPARSSILLDPARVERILGIDIPRNEIESLLRRLGMQVAGAGERLSVIPPSHRFDISIAEDLVEEVARLHGYDAIPATPATMPQRPAPASEGSVRRDRVLALLADRGYQEAITYSFIPAGLQSLFAPEGAALALSNPISADLAVMRRSLWPGLVLALRDNLRRQQERVRLFELGTRFETGTGDMIESLSLAGLAWGEAWPEQWGTTGRPADFYDVKADLVALLSLARPADDLSFVAAAPACLHPGRSARIEAEGRALGWIGELHPHISSQLELKNPPILFEVDFDSSFSSQIPKYKDISRFPAIRRDLAIVVADEISLAQIRESVSVSAGSALQELRVFDIYRGQGIEPGRKSVALGLILQETSRTLTDAEADQVVAAVVARLKSDQNATIRD
jgi:phenylalanyl-tRNA synthetase beta chain